MKIEGRDASDVKHLLFKEQQYITSTHFFLPNIYIKTSKLVRTRFRVRSQNHLKSLRVQPPSTMKLDREYITLDPTLLLEEDCLDKQQPKQLSLAREDSRSTRKNIIKVKHSTSTKSNNHVR